jgi:mRNA-degrading endonuclease HigB of HigAB toxin-antitoxin module
VGLARSKGESLLFADLPTKDPLCLVCPHTKVKVNIARLGHTRIYNRLQQVHVSMPPHAIRNANGEAIQLGVIVEDILSVNGDNKRVIAKVGVRAREVFIRVVGYQYEWAHSDR